VLGPRARFAGQGELQSFEDTFADSLQICVCPRMTQKLSEANILISGFSSGFSEFACRFRNSLLPTQLVLKPGIGFIERGFGELREVVYSLLNGQLKYVWEV
jgi:hypothetical protein